MSQNVESNLVVGVTLNRSLRIKNSKTRNKSARQAVSVERSRRGCRAYQPLKTGCFARLGAGG